MDITHRNGTTITQFHYDGLSVELDPQWSSNYYESRLEQFLQDAKDGGSQWGWYWLNQRAGLVFRFRLADSIGYAFTVRDYENIALDAPNAVANQIDDLRISN